MVEFFELALSPNSTKVRMALRFKGIDFTTTAVEIMDRAAVVAVSGQELAPVIKDKGVVINDSEAILQYLDANYPDARRLFPRTREARKACDAWKAELDEKVATPWFPVFFHAVGFAKTLDTDARQAYQDALKWLNDEIGDKDHYKEGEHMDVCDLRVAEWATYGLPGEGLIKRAPVFGKCKEIFGIEEGSLTNLERFLKPWNEFLA